MQTILPHHTSKFIDKIPELQNSVPQGDEHKKFKMKGSLQNKVWK